MTRGGDHEGETQMPTHGRRDGVALTCGLLAFCLHAACAGRYDLFRDDLA